jgi:hypothetical protein
MSYISILLSLITQLNPVANGVLPVSVEQRPKVKIAIEFPSNISLEPGAAVILGNARVGYVSSVEVQNQRAQILVTFDAPQCLTVSDSAEGKLVLNEKCQKVVAIKSIDEVASVGRPQGILKLLPTSSASSATIRGFSSVEDYWRS